MCLLLTILTGCHDAKLASAALSPLPGDLAALCYDPGKRLGYDAKGELARNRAALLDCRKKHRDTVAFYNDQRGGAAKE